MPARGMAVRKRISSSGASQSSGERKFDLEPKPAANKGVGAAAKEAKPKVPVLSTGLTDRLAERRAIATHDKRKKRLLWVGALGLLVLVVWLFGYSKVFALDLEHTRVSGASKYVKKDQILAAIEGQQDVPLARLDLEAINKAVLAVDNVKSVTQTRRWPNGVSITITERVPVAAVPVKGKYSLLDMEAVEVTTVEKAPKGLPIIKIAMTEGNQRTLTTALTILDELPEELLSEIGSISARTQDNISFTLRDGLTVLWGNSQDTELKIEVLNRLREIAHEEQKNIIDLSAPTFPIIK